MAARKRSSLPATTCSRRLLDWRGLTCFPQNAVCRWTWSSTRTFRWEDADHGRTDYVVSFSRNCIARIEAAACGRVAAVHRAAIDGVVRPSARHGAHRGARRFARLPEPHHGHAVLFAFHADTLFV